MKRKNQSVTILPSRQTWQAMDEVGRVRERVDIVSLISEYIPLKKMGRNFKALCPFHGEKTPSFVVSPERQIWHCFGCSKGGDCFTFLMEYENLEFVEALRILAKKTGIEIRTSSFQIGLASKKEKIYVLNRIAMDFYHYVLLNHSAGKIALDYLLNERRIDKLLIETFKLGFSPKSGDSLSEYLFKKKSYKKQDLIEAGLGFEKEGKVFDFFRGRVMFPLFDHRNNVIGFSARVIDDPPAGGFGGKYINSRETSVYHKGSVFFGLNMAKDAIKKLDRAIVVEGEFDAISLYKEGVENVVAIKGTALTEDQVNLLSRFTQNVSLCFDQDAAGYEATKRSLPLLEEKGFSINAIVFQDAKDADEAIKKDPFSFKKAIKESGNVYDYIFSQTLALYDKTTIDGKRKISSELLPVISNISNEIVKEHYLKKLSLDIGTSYESLVRELDRIEKKEVVKKEIVFEKKDKRERQEILEEYLVSIIIQDENPKIGLEIAIKTLADYKFSVFPYQKIFDRLKTYLDSKDVFNAKRFLETIPHELVETFDACYLLPVPKLGNRPKIEREVEKVAISLRVLFLKNKIKNLAKTMEKEEQKGTEIESLEKEISSLISLLPKD